MDTTAKNQLIINIWSDYVCPFCYLEEPVVSRVEAELAGAVAVRWRAFQLRPDPVPALDPKGSYLAEIWKRAVYPLALQRGMNIKLPPIQPRSRLALEAGLFAHCQGKSALFNHAVFEAFFVHGRDIGDMKVLQELAGQVGLNPLELSNALEKGVFQDQLARDEQLARDLGIVSVPSMLITRPSELMHDGVLIVGAEKYEVLNDALNGKLKQGQGDARLSA